MTHDERLQILRNADLYGITGECFSHGRDNIAVAEDMLKAGIPVLQYREKEKSMRKKYEQCVRLRELASRFGALFLINDHIDLCLAVEADGVHIGQDDLPLEAVRRLIGPDKIIGLSTHSPEQAEDAVRRKADYIGVGPIYRTFTKKDVCDPVGLSYLRYAAEHVSLPFVTIGGIKEHNVAEVVRNGAKCVCMVSEIAGAENIEETVKNIRINMKEAQHESV